MADPTDHLLRQRIRTLMPELKIGQFERDREGLINDVVIVNRSLVFRFAKTEKYAGRLAQELKILDLIRPTIGLDIPTPVHTGPDCMVYPFLDGKPLSRRIVLESGPAVRQAIAGQLGGFLHRLHSTETSKVDWEIPTTQAPVRPKDWLEIQARVKDKIYPLLQNYQVEWAERLFDGVLADPASGEYKPALIHGDLASYHLLFDEQEGRITGLIDFGMAGMGDPASDLGLLISIYGESFVILMGETYPELKAYLPRARFYSQLVELEWVLRGLETGETFWFTAHLGAARDLLA